LKNDLIIVMGDLDAKIGTLKKNDDKDIIGEFGQR
jgi:hypothetical protein